MYVIIIFFLACISMCAVLSSVYSLLPQKAQSSALALSSSFLSSNAAASTTISTSASKSHDEPAIAAAAPSTSSIFKGIAVKHVFALLIN
jgi:hypothetical protein